MYLYTVAVSAVDTQRKAARVGQPRVLVEIHARFGPTERSEMKGHPPAAGNALLVPCRT